MAQTEKADNSNTDISKYIDHLELIKRTLREQEEQPLLPSWAFLAWAMFIAIGVGVNSFTVAGLGWIAAENAVRVWVPVILMGGAVEMAGWVQFFRRDGRVLLTGQTIKLLLSFWGMIAAACGIGFGLVFQGAEIAGPLVLLLAIALFLVAVFSFKNLFIEAYASLAAGLLLTVVDVSALLADLLGFQLGTELAYSGNVSLVSPGMETAYPLMQLLAGDYLWAGFWYVLIFIIAGVHTKRLSLRKGDVQTSPKTECREKQGKETQNRENQDRENQDREIKAGEGGK